MPRISRAVAVGYPHHITQKWYNDKMEGVMIAKELQKKALQLNPLERIHFVEMILESLDKPDPEIEKAWVAESETRYARYKAGEIKAVSLNSVQKRLKR